MKRYNVFGASAWTSLLPRGLGAKVRDTYDGLIRTRMTPHLATNELLVERTQPDRNVILERTKRLRLEPEALRPSKLGVWALQIPTLDLQALKKANPDLDSHDQETRTRAWRKFIASPESEPYRVREKL